MFLVYKNYSVGLRQLESDNSKLSKKGYIQITFGILKGGSSWRANRHSALMWDGILLYIMVVMFLATEEGLAKHLQTVNTDTTKEASIPEYKSEEMRMAAHSREI